MSVVVVESVVVVDVVVIVVVVVVFVNVVVSFVVGGVVPVQARALFLVSVIGPLPASPYCRLVARRSSASDRGARGLRAVGDGHRRAAPLPPYLLLLHC